MRYLIFLIGITACTHYSPPKESNYYLEKTDGLVYNMVTGNYLIPREIRKAFNEASGMDIHKTDLVFIENFKGQIDRYEIYFYTRSGVSATFIFTREAYLRLLLKTITIRGQNV